MGHRSAVSILVQRLRRDYRDKEFQESMRMFEQATAPVHFFHAHRFSHELSQRSSPHQRFFSKALATTLSLLLSATGLVAFDSAVVFNEVQYHPVNELTQTEWIEIKSNQGVDIDISGWSITGGANFTFPANTVLTGLSPALRTAL
jgi:hypothetical protein